MSTLPSTQEADIFLINPATEQFGGAFADYVPIGIPVATGVLAAYMIKNGYKVKIHDEEFGKLTDENIVEKFSGLKKPFVVGISVLTAQAARTYHIVKMIKSRWPDTKVIVGGIHVTALPEEPLRKDIDFVVRGEGERALLNLFQQIRGDQDYSGVQNLSYWDGDKIKHNPEGGLIEDLDEIPMFPYELFDNPRYDMGFITSARGCPYKCSYCSQRLMTGLTFRYRSPAKIVEELDILINKYGRNHIVFYDDNFSFKKKRVIELCEAIIKSGLNKKAGFFIQTRADNLYEEIMPYLKEANFTGVGFGMETANERLAGVIVKNESVEQHKKAILLARKWGLDVSVFMIYGLPTETHEERMESLKFVKDWGFRFTKFNNLIPYPGTKTYNDVKATSGLQMIEDWGNFNSTLTATRSIFDTTVLPYVPAGTSAWQLKRDIHRSNYSFYLSPRTVLDVLMRKGGPGFVMLPPKWYLNPKEVMRIGKLGFTSMLNFGMSLLPEKLGGWIYLMVTGRKEDMIPRDQQAKQFMPDAIDGTMRTIRIEKKPKAAVGQSPISVSGDSKSPALKVLESIVPPQNAQMS
ncbi:MAG: radical SAM protein [Bdellovibrionales bacterium]